MTILDANIVIYAYNQDAPHHRPIAKWLEDLFEGPDLVGLPWVTIWAFLRISTNVRAWPNPISVADAFAVVDALLGRPNATILHPGPRHRELLQTLVQEGNASGSLLTDAALAALAIENGAALASTDRDFSRFRNLRWIDPLAAQ
jgi:toxin-antitoxin system PIN domain toxin